jgi:hypothetical protein
MKQETVFIILILVVATVGLGLVLQAETTGMQVISDYTLAGYPYYFFTGHIFNGVVLTGESLNNDENAAVTLVTNEMIKQYQVLKQSGSGYYHVRIDPGELKGKIVPRYDFRMKNAIVIGSPCHNHYVSMLLDIDNCRTYFKPGQGMVRLVEAYGHLYLIITGYSGKEVLATAQLFTNYVNTGRAQGKVIHTALKPQAVRVPNLAIGEPIGKELPALY